MENKHGNLDVSSGIYNYYGPRPNGGIQAREAKKAPSQRADKARRIYLESRSSVSVEFPYWYTRGWEELEGEIPIIRRAEALKSGFAHLTPAILPGELLAMRKASYLLCCNPNLLTLFFLIFNNLNFLTFHFGQY